MTYYIQIASKKKAFIWILLVQFFTSSNLFLEAAENESSRNNISHASQTLRRAFPSGEEEMMISSGAMSPQPSCSNMYCEYEKTSQANDVHMIDEQQKKRSVLLEEGKEVQSLGSSSTNGCNFLQADRTVGYNTSGLHGASIENIGFVYRPLPDCLNALISQNNKIMKSRNFMTPYKEHLENSLFSSNEGFMKRIKYFYRGLSNFIRYNGTVTEDLKICVNPKVYNIIEQLYDIRKVVYSYEYQIGEEGTSKSNMTIIPFMDYFYDIFHYKDPFRFLQSFDILSFVVSSYSFISKDSFRNESNSLKRELEKQQRFIADLLSNEEQFINHISQMKEVDQKYFITLKSKSIISIAEMISGIFKPKNEEDHDTLVECISLKDSIQSTFTTIKSQFSDIHEEISRIQESNLNIHDFYETLKKNIIQSGQSNSNMVHTLKERIEKLLENIYGKDEFHITLLYYVIQYFMALRLNEEKELTRETILMTTSFERILSSFYELSDKGLIDDLYNVPDCMGVPRFYDRITEKTQNNIFFTAVLVTLYRLVQVMEHKVQETYNLILNSLELLNKDVLQDKYSKEIIGYLFNIVSHEVKYFEEAEYLINYMIDKDTYVRNIATILLLTNQINSDLSIFQDLSRPNSFPDYSTEKMWNSKRLELMKKLYRSYNELFEKIRRI